MFRADNMDAARREALEQARGQLRTLDLAQTARNGGLDVTTDGLIRLGFFGRGMKFNPQTFSLSADDGEPVHIIEETLTLRYLAAQREVTPSGDLITFRDMPGGAFYLQPIHDRTSMLVLRRFGNDLAGLRHAVSHFPHTSGGPGDLGVTIPAIGRIDLTLIYRLGDEEFSPTLDILFDRIISGVYHLDEVAALAQRLCFGLIRQAPIAPGEVS